ncbi:MAG: hypothetical protein GNW80_00750 [Asgard group archaeon]|nr:hypothetical protein [Asgard group archaeon]
MIYTAKGHISKQSPNSIHADACASIARDCSLISEVSPRCAKSKSSEQVKIGQGQRKPPSQEKGV